MQTNPIYDVSKKYLLRSDAASSQSIPLYDKYAVAGSRIPLDRITIPNLPKCDGALLVRGDSMMPILNPGDIVCYKLVNSRRGGLFYGEMYLLSFVLDGDEYVTIKHVYKSARPGHYRLISHNPNHPPRDIPVDSVRVMALVKASIRFSCIG